MITYGECYIYTHIRGFRKHHISQYIYRERDGGALYAQAPPKKTSNPKKKKKT